MLKDNKCSCLVSLLNDCIPTNQLLIAASLEMHGHPRLCNGSMRRLIERLNKIESRHSVKIKAEDNQIKR